MAGSPKTSTSCGNRWRKCAVVPPFAASPPRRGHSHRGNLLAPSQVAGEMESTKVKIAKYEENKKWRSSEVSQVDEESEVKTAERIALDLQEEIRKLSLESRMAKAAEGKLAGAPQLPLPPARALCRPDCCLRIVPDRARRAGTALFKQQNWDGALAAYSDGFDHVRSLDDPADMVTARDIRLSLALNLAAVCLKLEQWGKAVTYASKALEVEPENVKALYRRGQVIHHEAVST